MWKKAIALMSILMAKNSKYANCTVTLTHSRTKNLEEYTKSAIDFYLDRKKIVNIKNHLSNSTNTKNLFDSKQFTLDLEKIFLDLIKNKN